MAAEGELFQNAIASYSSAAQKTLARLRGLVLENAKTLDGVGPITEALRWGQFSFLTLETGSGSTFRIDGRKNDPNIAVMYFHCQSGLIDHFKELYGNQLSFEGKRAIVLDVRKRLPESELRHCISLALTHHLRKIPTKSRKR
jgi:hypothetical protein